MSKILERARELEQQSNKTTEHLRNVIKKDYEQLEKYSKMSMENTLSTLQEDINQFNQRLKKTLEMEQKKTKSMMIWLVKKPLIITGIITVILLIIWLSMIVASKKEYYQMIEWKNYSQTYKKQSHNIQIQKCTSNEGETLLCMELDPKYEDMNWKNHETGRILNIILEK